MPTPALYVPVGPGAYADPGPSRPRGGALAAGWRLVAPVVAALCLLAATHALAAPAAPGNELGQAQAEAATARQRLVEARAYAKACDDQRNQLQWEIDGVARQGVDTRIIDANIAMTEKELRDLERDRNDTLDDYRRGFFCTGCGGSRTEILKNNNGVFPHKGQNVRAATPEELANKEREYDLRIDPVQSRLVGLKNQRTQALAAHEKSLADARRDVAAVRDRCSALDGLVQRAVKEVSDAQGRLFWRQREAAVKAQREREQQQWEADARYRAFLQEQIVQARLKAEGERQLRAAAAQVRREREAKRRREREEAERRRQEKRLQAEAAERRRNEEEHLHAEAAARWRREQASSHEQDAADRQRDDARRQAEAAEQARSLERAQRLAERLRQDLEEMRSRERVLELNAMAALPPTELAPVLRDQDGATDPLGLADVAPLADAGAARTRDAGEGGQPGLWEQLSKTGGQLQRLSVRARVFAAEQARQYVRDQIDAKRQEILDSPFQFGEKTVESRFSGVLSGMLTEAVEDVEGKVGWRIPFARDFVDKVVGDISREVRTRLSESVNSMLGLESPAFGDEALDRATRDFEVAVGPVSLFYRTGLGSGGKGILGLRAYATDVQDSFLSFWDAAVDRLANSTPEPPP